MIGFQPGEIRASAGDGVDTANQAGAHPWNNAALALCCPLGRYRNGALASIFAHELDMR